MVDKSILKEQVAYYRARAAEYDEWHSRQGRYDRGDEHNLQWYAELDTVRAELERERPFGKKRFHNCLSTITRQATLTKA